MLLKAIVSAMHRKEDFNGYKLDLAYITPQLIAAAMPTNGYLQSFYRTQLSVLLEFLDSKHPGHWHIWNLQEDQELGYDTAAVVTSEGCPLVTRVPTPDHRPLTMVNLVNTTQQIHEFLQSDNANVALVHCKCGKGRTGSLIAAYLMLYHGMASERARNEFTKHRMRLAAFDAVAIPSQQRFLGYLQKIAGPQMDSSVLGQETHDITVTRVIVRNPQFDEYDLRVLPLKSGTSRGVQDWKITVKSGLHFLQTAAATANSRLPADLVMVFVGYSRVAGVPIPRASVCFPFNADFESSGSEEPHASGTAVSQWTRPASLYAVSSESGIVNCMWSETDGIGGLPLRGTKAFDSIEVFWTRSPPSDPAASVAFFDPPV